MVPVFNASGCKWNVRNCRQDVNYSSLMGNISNGIAKLLTSYDIYNVDSLRQVAAAGGVSGQF